MSCAEHPVWEEGGRPVPADTLANASTARPTYRRLHHIPGMSHPDSEVACLSRAALFFSPCCSGGATHKLSLPRRRRSPGPTPQPHLSFIFFLLPQRGRLIPFDIPTKRVTSFQVGRWRAASASAARPAVTVQSVVQPRQSCLFAAVFCLRNSQMREHRNFSSHRFTV